MNRTQSHTMSRQRLRNSAILVLLLFSPGLGLAASPEEVLTRAIRGILAPGEGQTSEAIYAAQGGAASEADLPLMIRFRDVPAKVASTATKIERDDEVNIGRGVAARLLAQYGAWHEPTLRQYVNLVGQTLTQSVGRDDITYHVQPDCRLCYRGDLPWLWARARDRGGQAWRRIRLSGRVPS